MAYVLENMNEWERLDYQSTLPLYDFKKELQGLSLGRNAALLDAGCGSGIVSRYLAEIFPDCKIMGCDYAQDRVEKSREFVQQKYSNLQFDVENLAQLSYSDNTFDAIVCRYVIQHLTPEARAQTLSHFLRCLKPNGILYLIDYDGPLHNIYPRTPIVDEMLTLLEKDTTLDLKIGRKMPSQVLATGFTQVDWNIELANLEGDLLRTEIELLETRLDYALPFLERISGSKEKATHFVKEFLESLAREGTVYFFNKFIVTARKPS